MKVRQVNRYVILVSLIVCISFILMGTLSAFAKTPTIALVPKWEGIPYFTVAAEGAKLAGKQLGVNVIYVGPSEPDATQQVQVINNLILRGVDAIGISVMDANVLKPVIKKAREAGIHVFTWDSDAPDSEREVMVQQVSPKELGYTVMDLLAKEMNYKGKFAIITGDLASNQLNEWMEYEKERYQQKYAKTMELASIKAPGVTFDKVFDTVSTMMRTMPEITGYIGEHSEAGPGIAAAAEHVKVSPQKVVAVAITTPDNMRKYFKKGNSVVRYGVLWDVKALGYVSVWVGKQLIEGKPLTDKVPGIEQFEAIEEGYPKYIPEKKWVLLGPPLIFNEKNIDKYHF
ncbi:MAG: autoinducer 2 ABC transporter substrate-binding protein [Firmicutes bacterium]|nr:autoinducer 2 ABC transporter substrate-binding protein [Bacillota bacterium]